MTTAPILLVAALAVLAWYAFRGEGRRQRFVPCTAERVLGSLTERLARGELTPDEYTRLVALIR